MHFCSSYREPVPQFFRALHCIQIVYQVQLENGVAVMVMLYLVYAQPSIQHCHTDILPLQRGQADMQDGYQWHLVTRGGSGFISYDLCHDDCMVLLLMHSLMHLPKSQRSECASGQS